MTPILWLSRPIQLAAIGPNQLFPSSPAQTSAVAVAPRALTVYGPSTPPESQVSTSAALPPPTTPETNRTRPHDVPSTPFKFKTQSVTRPSSSLSLSSADQNNTAFWASLLRENGRICRNIEFFLPDFVPCDVPVPLDICLATCLRIIHLMVRQKTAVAWYGLPLISYLVTD